MVGTNIYWLGLDENVMSVSGYIEGLSLRLNIYIVSAPIQRIPAKLEFWRHSPTFP